MTHHPIRTLPDGTRVYSNGVRYKPKPLHERKYGINKPDDPRAVRFHGLWFLPLDVLDDEERELPETRPDSVAYDHMFVNTLCKCAVCSRPEAELWRKRWRRAQGLQP